MEDKKGEKSARRQRKKKLIGEVKDILEFYFSAVNVGKDKFMQILLEKDPNVDLEIFFRFNKIKTLTNEIKILQKAVKKSEILSLSEDGCRVKRTAPLIMKENDVDCTIYVENLPPNSSHEWLQRVFSLYGVIDYISLPRFQQSGRPKGFAFIEFHTPQEAEKALESFGGLASLDGTLNPAELLTIRTFGQTDEIDDSHLKSSLSPKDKIAEEEQCKKRSAAETFAGDDDNTELEEMSHKKMRDSEEKEKEADREEKEKETETGKKQKKKRKKRMKKEKEYEPDSVFLRVMSKRNWKRLRNKYLNIQRDNMRQLKQSMYRSYHARENSPKPGTNFCTTETKEEGSTKATKPEFMVGVIVKITLSEPLHDPKEFREGFANGKYSIAFVDIIPETSEVYVRFKSSDDCKNFISEGLWQNIRLLEGDEETTYWEKIFASWESRRNRRKKGNRNPEPATFRGRDKLFNKALKNKNIESARQHVVFDD